MLLVEAMARLGPARITDMQTFIPAIVDRCAVSARSTYRPHLLHLATAMATRAVSSVTLSDLELERDIVRRRAAEHRISRAKARGRSLRSWDPDAHGHGAAENFVRACRFAFNLAVVDGLIGRSPAIALRVPPRPPAPERPLETAELEQLWQVASSTGDDPELDRLILLLARHTAARREGLINLTLDALDEVRGTITLSEKGGKPRELPLQRDLIRAALAFARQRGACLPHDRVLRYRSGRPITRRRFMTLFNRLDAHTEWSERLDVGVHWIRHTTLADIATVAGLRVAAAYAGHSDGSLGVIGSYTKVPPAHLRAAYTRVFGQEPQP